MQTLFEIERYPRDPAVVLQRNIAELGGENVDRHFAERVLQGVLGHTDALRCLIERHAPHWPIERMDGVARSLLHIGAYELAFLREASLAVVINEAIEIAKEYGDGEAGRFVNGVLNAVAHSDEGDRKSEV